MNIHILAFGIAKEILGSDAIILELPDGAAVAALKNKLEILYPAMKSLQTYMIAVNEAYATDDKVLNMNDEVAIIPPVSGG